MCFFNIYVTLKRFFWKHVIPHIVLFYYYWCLRPADHQSQQMFGLILRCVSPPEALGVRLSTLLTLDWHSWVVGWLQYLKRFFFFSSSAGRPGVVTGGWAVPPQHRVLLLRRCCCLCHRLWPGKNYRTPLYNSFFYSQCSCCFLTGPSENT